MSNAFGWWQTIGFWTWTNSEFLLALMVSACGGIGTLISMLRDESKQSSQQRQAMDYAKLFILGLSTGFLVFFVVRGGKAVFLLQSDTVSFPTNPYTASLAGLIAGIFTDRAYKLLMAAVDQLADKIMQVIGKPSDKDHTPEQPPS